MCYTYCEKEPSMTKVLSTTTVRGHDLLRAAQRRQEQIDEYYTAKMEEEIAAYPKFVGTDLPILKRFNPRRELTRDEIVSRLDDSLDHPYYIAAKMWHQHATERLAKIAQVASLARNNLVELTGEDLALVTLENFD